MNGQGQMPANTMKGVTVNPTPGWTVCQTEFIDQQKQLPTRFPQPTTEFPTKTFTSEKCPPIFINRQEDPPHDSLSVDVACDVYVSAKKQSFGYKVRLPPKASALPRGYFAAISLRAQAGTMARRPPASPPKCMSEGQVGLSGGLDVPRLVSRTVLYGKTGPRR